MVNITFDILKNYRKLINEIRKEDPKASLEDIQKTIVNLGEDYTERIVTAFDAWDILKNAKFGDLFINYKGNIVFFLEESSCGKTIGFPCINSFVDYTVERGYDDGNCTVVRKYVPIKDNALLDDFFKQCKSALKRCDKYYDKNSIKRLNEVINFINEHYFELTM